MRIVREDMLFGLREFLTQFFCLFSRDSKNNLISTSSCITFISEVYFKNFTTCVMAKVGSPSNFGHHSPNLENSDLGIQEHS
jgi:hypothetical protein